MEIVDYGPLWETMRRNNVTQYQLLQSGIDNHTLDSLKKGGNITMLTLEKLCKIIGCTPNDVVSLQNASPFETHFDNSSIIKSDSRHRVR